MEYMDSRSQTITITQVGKAIDSYMKKAKRGTFNFESIKDFFSQPIKDNLDKLTIDLSKIGWISLFDWSCLLAYLNGKLEENPSLKILLDFVGNNIIGLIPYQECADFFDGHTIAPKYSRDKYLNSYVTHRVLSFVKAVEGTNGFLHQNRLKLLGVDKIRNSWYIGKKDKSVILARSSIPSKGNKETEEEKEKRKICTLYANREQIGIWREDIKERLEKELSAKTISSNLSATIFQSEEFWRVLCYELICNIYEHSGKPGHICARLIFPKKGHMPLWCNNVYEHLLAESADLTKSQKTNIKDLKSRLNYPFLELCVSDCGKGIPSTLKDAFIRQSQKRHLIPPDISSITDADILKFAFDELGSCRDEELSWITDRHALGQMLLLTRKYGGTFTIRSGKASLSYFATTTSLIRSKTRLGYEPEYKPVHHDDFQGTHIQIIIPLLPSNISKREKANLVEYNPESLNIEEKHPIGPLIPLRDKIRTLSYDDPSESKAKFKIACRKLAKECLESHPSSEPIIFDFSDLDWQPGQFETFLYLMQNVFIWRRILLMQIPTYLAEVINSYEDLEQPTFLSETMVEELRNIQKKMEREFSEGQFLETYSSMGSLILAIDSKGKKFIFGLRSQEMRQALLEIVDGEWQSSEGLASNYGLDKNVVNAVLKGANKLFNFNSEHKTWHCIWDSAQLYCQMKRGISSYFDLLINKSDAWHGKFPKGEKKRFYLPTEDKVYTSFFESSRILTRERYVTEVAERLLHRLSYGLELKNLKFDDVDILACSTTPSVMLASAIARLWPSPMEKHPVVMDYGPYLFSGDKPPHIHTPAKNSLRVVIVHDFFDNGRLSGELANLIINKQKMEVLLELCFLRFDKIEESETSSPDNYFEQEIYPNIKMLIHAMIAIPRPVSKPRLEIIDWGMNRKIEDYVVDSRSLKPVPLKSLRLISGYSEERSLEDKRDRCFKELDTDEDSTCCRIISGHFVYGQRHFGIVVDVAGVLLGRIGKQITSWLADVCCNVLQQNASWEDENRIQLEGEVSAILMPLHSQIHYILPQLKIELAQRGKRIPYFLLDVTSLGGGVETYDIPDQLRNHLVEAKRKIQQIMNSSLPSEEVKKEIRKKQLRLLIIDDAIFSGRTIQTILNSLAKYIRLEKQSQCETGAIGPIEWIRTFAVFNELPAAESALWHRLSSCAASSNFRFDTYAPFIGVATFSAKNCPTCKKLRCLNYLEHKIELFHATDVANWIKEEKETLTPFTMEAPAFYGCQKQKLPEPFEMFESGATANLHTPIHIDSAIWRFQELMYLSYPLKDVLKCLSKARKAGQIHQDFHDEYARFRLAVYEWCILNWHHVRLYHAEEIVLQELTIEAEVAEDIFTKVVYQLNDIMPNENIIEFIKAMIDLLAKWDINSNKIATKKLLNLDIGLTLFFAGQHPLNYDIKNYLHEKYESMPRESSFISILYFRLTQPFRKTDPYWGLSVIAETCFRGIILGSTQDRLKSDHKLLGVLVKDAIANNEDIEIRRRLEGCLSSFISAVDNIVPYFDENLLGNITRSARETLEWLRNGCPSAPSGETPLNDLHIDLCDDNSWEYFENCCHITMSDFEGRLNDRNDQLKNDDSIYSRAEFHVETDPSIKECYIMTHISDIIAFISNFAIEPAKDIEPSAPSVVNISPSTLPHKLKIEIFTRFGNSTEACNNINIEAFKTAHNVDRLELFGVEFNDKKTSYERCSEKRELVIVDPKHLDDGIILPMLVPIGFKPHGERR